MPDSVPEHPNEPAGELRWPTEGLSRIPDWVYTSAEIYQREIQRIARSSTISRACRFHSACP